MSLSAKSSFLLSLLYARAAGRRIPLTVIFNVTDRCNLKCAYCYAGYHRRRKPELTTGQIRRAIDELAEMGCRRVSISGGEPLLRKDIGEIIGHVRSLGLMCTVNSNGALVPRRIDDLRGIDALALSLDGDREAHDAYRGEGSFDRVIEAIEAARAAGIRVHTNTVLTKKNLHTVKFVLDLADEYEIMAEFNLCIAYLFDRDKAADYKSDDEKIRDVLREIIRYKDEGRRILFSRQAYELSLKWPSYDMESVFGEEPDFPHARCAAGRYFCFFDTDGTLYACPHLMGLQKGRSVVADGLARAFDGLDDHDCRACYQVYHNEFNLLFGLDWRVLANQIRNNLFSFHRERE
ncbi:MAG TPA: radical SAM protein [Deltaproteobacteria bacterium]|nr:radical SAM protein [Deltaproteobacteria bacterium]